MLYTETVSRRFINGTLKGVTITEAINRITYPREIGSTHKVEKPFSGSGYLDTVVAVNDWKG